MKGIFNNRTSKTSQSLISLGIVALVTGICFFLTDFLEYKLVAFILLLVVSLLAVLFDILPVILAATFSAIAWNFLFIPPRYTFRIATVEDGVFFCMYFIVAIINGILTFRIKQVEKEVRKKEERAQTIQLYNTLFNSLSHELKTPISAIIGATDTLKEHLTHLTVENQADLLDDISEAGLRLNQQVENLLNMSRLESGQLRLKTDWCDITEMTYSLLHRLDAQLRQHVVHLSIEPNLPLYKLDHLLIEQVIGNILYNAAAYTAAGTDIFISIKNNSERSYELRPGTTEHSPLVNEVNYLLIIIEDRGHGFPEQEIEKVFDKFYRLEHSTPGGTGLGLSIVKGFVEAHNGTVVLENVPKGARFTICIPAEVSYIHYLKNE